MISSLLRLLGIAVLAVAISCQATAVDSGTVPVLEVSETPDTSEVPTVSEIPEIPGTTEVSVVIAVEDSDEETREEESEAANEPFGPALPADSPDDNGNAANDESNNESDKRAMMISYGTGRDHHATLHLPDGDPAGPLPVAVLIHGGFWAEPWDNGLMTSMAEDLAAHGVASWNIEYGRIDGGSVTGTGGWPQTGADVHAAISHLAVVAETQPLDLERVVLVGHSAGGHLALWAIEEAERRGGPIQPIQAIGLAAVTDLDVFANRSERLIGAPRSESPEAWDDAQPALRADQVTLIHGDIDKSVPLESVANAQANGIEPIVITDLDHMGIIEPSHPAWPQIRSVILGSLDAFTAPPAAPQN